MGKATQAQLVALGHECVGEIGPDQKICTESLSNADIVIEATVPEACVKNVENIITEGKPVLIITTGWYEHLEDVKNLIEKYGGKAMYASNFSIGVNLYFQMVEKAAQLMNGFEDYDVWATELHHKFKADSPSGTAKTLEDILLKNLDRKTEVVEESLQRQIQPHELHFSSTRGGVTNFSHTIGFDSASDVIELKHSARNRDGYASGAARSAAWLVDQKPGFYTMTDFLS